MNHRPRAYESPALPLSYSATTPRIPNTRQIRQPSSRSGQLEEAAGRDVEDEAVDAGRADPGMGAQPLDRRADARLERRRTTRTRCRGRRRSTRRAAAWMAASSAPWSPHPVWPMTTISSVPSSVWLTISERMTSSVARPPALRMMCASPVRRPSVSSTSSRASMQATIAMPRSGAAVSADRSKDSVYRSFSARILPNSPRSDTRAGGQPPGPNSSVSQCSSGLPEVAAPRRTDADPGASGGSDGAPAARLNAISCGPPRP